MKSIYLWHKTHLNTLHQATTFCYSTLVIHFFIKEIVTGQTALVSSWLKWPLEANSCQSVSLHNLEKKSWEYISSIFWMFCPKASIFHFTKFFLTKFLAFHWFFKIHLIKLKLLINVFTRCLMPHSNLGLNNYMQLQNQRLKIQFRK